MMGITSIIEIIIFLLLQEDLVQFMVSVAIFFYTPSTGEEVMMNDPQFLRAPTIFQKYYEQGAKIAIVTAKDKLRKLLSHGLNFNDARAICFSSEKSDQATISENGIENINNWLGMDVPDVYSQGLSEFVMAAGVKLLHEFKPDIMYLSTTCLLYTSPSPRDGLLSRMPSSA